MVKMVSMAALVHQETRAAEAERVYLVSQGSQESEGCQDRLAQMVKTEFQVSMELMEQTELTVVEAQWLASFL